MDRSGNRQWLTRVTAAGTSIGHVLWMAVVTAGRWLIGTAPCDSSEQPSKACKRAAGILAAVFVWSISQLVEDTYEFLEVPALTAAANVVGQLGIMGPARPDLADIAIVKIDPAVFRSRYAATQPLDRCALRDDLRRLARGMEKKPRPGQEPSPADYQRIVAVDFGLAPPFRIQAKRYLSPNPGSQDDESRCQDDIDRLLDEHGSAWILLLPFEYPLRAGGGSTGAGQADSHQGSTAAPAGGVPDDGALRCVEKVAGGAVLTGQQGAEVERCKLVYDWVQARCLKGVRLGPAILSENFGMVTRATYTRFEPDGNCEFVDFTTLIRRQMGMAKPEGRGCGEGKTCERDPIQLTVLSRFHSGGMTLPITSACLEHPAADGCPRPVRGVIFGSGYTPDDEFLTPMGWQSGVDILAAIAAGVHGTRAGHVAAVLSGVVIDLLLGVVAERRFQRTWSSLLRSAGRTRRIHKGNRHLTKVMIRSFQLIAWFLGFVSIAALIGWISYLVGIWINPVTMIVGMALSAFFLTTVELAVEQQSRLDGRSQSKQGGGGAVETGESEGGHRPPPRCRPARAVLRLAGIGLFGWAVWKLLNPLFE